MYSHQIAQGFDSLWSLKMALAFIDRFINLSCTQLLYPQADDSKKMILARILVR